MPAKRATSRGLPLGFDGRAARTAADSSTKAEAVAVRREGCFALTSTMVAWPDESKCESCGCSALVIRPLRIATCERLSRLQANRRSPAQPGSNWIVRKLRDRQNRATERFRREEAGRMAD